MSLEQYELIPISQDVVKCPNCKKWMMELNEDNILECRNCGLCVKLEKK